MTKDTLMDYDTDPAQNTDIGGIDIQGTAAISNFDNAFRRLMAHIKSDAFDMDNMEEGTDTKILTAAERTKLTAIEASADVTDSANVESALDASTSYRLGIHSPQITDWDDASKNGFYWGVGASNGPTASDYYLGIVIAHNNDWITQKVHLFTGDSSTDTKMYQREKNGGTWGSWFRIYQSETEIKALIATDPFVVFNGSTGTILESNKVSSLSKTATGKYTVTFESGAFANANYMGSGSARKNDGTDDANMSVQTGGTTSLVQTATTGYIRVSYNTTNTFIDSDLVGVYYFGGQ